MNTRKITIHSEAPEHFTDEIIRIIWEDALSVAVDRADTVAGTDAAECFKIVSVKDGCAGEIIPYAPNE